MGILDHYDLIVKNAKKNLANKKDTKYLNSAPIYQFKDTILILSAAGPIVDTYLLIHNLSDYKHKDTNIEIGMKLNSNIEKLIFSNVSRIYFTLNYLGSDCIL